MSNTTTLFLVLFVSSLLSFAAGAYVHLATGNGVISSYQKASGSYALFEDFWCATCDEQLWELETDSSFPTGVFIHSKLHPTLVWDSQSELATNGNPIILWEKKNTEAATKNQRWQFTSSNQYALVKNTNFVAKVYDTWNIKLANKNNSDTTQQFTVLGDDDLATVTITNTANYPLWLNFYTPAGDFSGSFSFDDTEDYIIPKGSSLFIQDDNENGMGWWAITGDIHITVPVPLPDFPFGLTDWVGSSNGLEGNDATVTFDFIEGSTTLGGYGTDYFGEFLIGGNYDVGGSVNFDRTYDTFTHNCEGALYPELTEMSGVCFQDSYIFVEQFHYTIVTKK